MSNLIPAVLAAAISVLLTKAIVWMAHRRGWLVFPRADRWNPRAVAQFGGVAILLAFLLGAGMLVNSRQGRTLCLLVLAMGALGLWDDIQSLRPGLKLLGQTVLAGAAVWCGLVYPLTPYQPVNVVVTVFWIVGITNAFNLLDNMDGLAAGVGIITIVFLVLLKTPASEVILLSAMAGALAGYLVFNYYPARIFMGDTGSLPLGFFLACAFIWTVQPFSTMLPVLFTPVLVLFIPIFDTALVSITRRLNGKAISSGGRDHSSHRLVMLGLGERNAVLTLYAVSALSGAVALAWRNYWPALGPGILVLFLAGGALFWLYLARVQLPEDWLSRTNVFAVVIPRLLQSIATRGAAMCFDAGLLLLSMYLAVLLRFEGIPSWFLPSFLTACAAAVIVKIPAMVLFSVYHRRWRADSVRDLYPLFKACLVGSLLLVLVLAYWQHFQDLSRAVIVIDFGLSFTLCGSARLSHKLFDDLLPKARRSGPPLAGDEIGPAARRYLAIRRGDGGVIALAACSSGKECLPELPVLNVMDVPETAAAATIDSLYLLPQCLDPDRNFLIAVAGEAGIPVYKFESTIASPSPAEVPHRTAAQFQPVLPAGKPAVAAPTQVPSTR